MKNSYLMLIVLGFIAFACNQEPVDQQPIDAVPPGSVSNVKVKNTPGGAILTYTLPMDEDLLYVKAVYSLKEGVMSESRSSLYTDTLRIAGFGDTKERLVKLIAVDRSRNESPEVDITITPLEPAVTTIGKTLNLVEDFGGVHAYWENPSNAEISVVMLKEDNNKEYVPIKTIYSSMAAGDGAQRGMDTILYKFGVYVMDRWENRSEIKYFTLKPIYETQFDRLKMKPVYLPNDEPAAYGWVLSRIIDGIIGDQGFHTAVTGNWPQSITIDLGITGRISRIKEFQRQGYGYYHGNLKHFEIWGCADLDPTGNWAKWTKLLDCTSIKPSGLPTGQNSNEDLAKVLAGEEYLTSPLANPKVRYIRLRALESWGGGQFFHLSEIQVFGDNR